MPPTRARTGDRTHNLSECRTMPHVTELPTRAKSILRKQIRPRAYNSGVCHFRGFGDPSAQKRDLEQHLHQLERRFLKWGVSDSLHGGPLAFHFGSFPISCRPLFCLNDAKHLGS